MQMSDEDVRLAQMRRCEICGKNIFRINYDLYAWKDGGKYYCSYTCIRIADKKKAKKRKGKVYREVMQD